MVNLEYFGIKKDNKSLNRYKNPWGQKGMLGDDTKNMTPEEYANYQREQDIMVRKIMED